MSRLYYVERTDSTGHWRVYACCYLQRVALRAGRQLARENLPGLRRRVTVRVRATHKQSPMIAGWINGMAAWGEAFR